MKDAGADFKVQTGEFVSEDEIRTFMKRFDHILIHLDIDEHRLHNMFSGISLFTD